MIGLCRTDEMANNLKLNYWETLKFTNLQKYIKFLSLFSTKSRFCQIQVEYLLNKVSTYKVYVEECIQTFIGKYTVHTNGFQSSMYKFVFKNRLNLSKRNLKFELKRNFDFVDFVGYCDLASLKKVHPDNKKSWGENTGQPKSARAFCCLGLWKMKISHFP